MKLYSAMRITIRIFLVMCAFHYLHWLVALSIAWLWFELEMCGKSFNSLNWKVGYVYSLVALKGENKEAETNK